ncbi:GGDEF domain-containing protein [Acidaminobacter sp. JC074]|uniref:GGDEF domain-containing protein n=1 Tax=Acidaminobacter sp. JC074 TaxID=2530199 RepID=UPI001F0E16C2|nr:GGDEF domain-containing protein [Acidaminobacter sp. JC074]MCH4889965.1 GGDEF domain-containing protein [Acidaminobacter sp. JC074]
MIESTSTFKSSMTKNNIVRILILGIIYTSMEIVGLTLSSLGFFESDIRFYVSLIVGFHLIYLPVVYVLYRRRTFKVLNQVQYIYFYVIMTWGSVFNVLMYIKDEDITIYSIVILLISALFIIRPLISRIMYALNFIFFASLIYINVSDILVFNQLVFKSLIVTVIAVLISNSNYNVRKKLSDSQKDLLLVNEKLKDQALKDSLTKLYNNGYLFDFLDKAVNNKVYCGNKFSFLMIDIDDFKGINDQYGHLFGDQVIKTVANKLEVLTRDIDIVCRYGGEEFVVILCHADLEVASQIAERIRSEIEREKVEGKVGVTVSIGGALYQNQAPLALIKEADDKLYMAKNAGKNRVVI